MNTDDTIRIKEKVGRSINQAFSENDETKAKKDVDLAFKSTKLDNEIYPEEVNDKRDSNEDMKKKNGFFCKSGNDDEES